MRIAKVPPEFKQPFYSYPPHNTDVGIERAFDLSVRDLVVDADVTYLPIYWTNNYHAQGKRTLNCQLQFVPEIERYLGSLDNRTQYFTIVQCDDGIYEKCPTNIFVFGSGGVGDEPIPLLCSPHPRRDETKNLLASFMGNIETGGPLKDAKRTKASSWDKNGPGARIRRKMKDVFSGVENCVVLPSHGSSQQAIQDYRNLAHRSQFGLAPRGYGKTSYRLYEMLSLGAIPVYIYEEPWLPYQEQVNWEGFCILCPEKELEFLPARLASVSQEWKAGAMQIAASLIKQYFSLEGTCRQIIGIVKERWG